MNFSGSRFKNIFLFGALLGGAVLLLTAVFAGLLGHHGWGPVRLGLLGAGLLAFLPASISLLYRTRPALLQAVWSGLRVQMWLIPLYVLILVVFSWFVTNGTWKFFEVQKGYGLYYDYQADSMLKGRLDVPLDAIGGEEFTYAGRYYSYLGFAPALLRIPLHFLFPDLWGKWSRIMLLLGCLVNTFTAAGFFSLLAARLGLGQKSPSTGAQVAYSSIFIAAAGLGSSNLFLATHASVYHEAIMLGSAFAMLCYYALYRYLTWAKNAGWLAAALAAAFLSFFCRSITGAGAMAAFVVLILVEMGRALPALKKRLEQPWSAALCTPPSHRAGMGAALLAIILLQLWTNYARFGSPTAFFPIQYQTPYIIDPARTARIQGTMIHPSNIAYSFSTYFLPGSARFEPSFPPLVYTFPIQFLRRFAVVDIVEPVSAASVTSSVFLLLALTGLAAACINWRKGVYLEMLVLLGPGLAATTLGTLSFASTSERYLHDFYPSLALFGALGAAFMLTRAVNARRAVRVLLPLALALLVLFNSWEMFAFSYRVQMDVWVAPPGRKTELHALSDRLSPHLGLPPNQANLVDIYKAFSGH